MEPFRMNDREGYLLIIEIVFQFDPVARIVEIRAQENEFPVSWLRGIQGSYEYGRGLSF